LKSSCTHSSSSPPSTTTIALPRTRANGWWASCWAPPGGGELTLLIPLQVGKEGRKEGGREGGRKGGGGSSCAGACFLVCRETKRQVVIPFYR
jgi:hypothetical protein